MAMSLKPYVAGGSAAVVATMCVHPFDLLKTRVQMQVVPAGHPRLGSVQMARQIVTEGGITKLYAGLSAAIMRQAVYGVWSGGWSGWKSLRYCDGAYAS